MALILILLPLIASGLFFFLKGKTAGWVALFAALANLGVTVAMLTQFDPSGGFQFEYNRPWVPLFGLQFHFGADGITMLLLLLTNLLTPIIIGTGITKDWQPIGRFFGLVLLMNAGLNGVFLAMDGLVFYLFWELTLFPIWFICASFGGPNRLRITLKFFIYTFSGSLLMLVALIYIYLQTPTPNSFDLDAMYHSVLNHGQSGWLFWFLFIAFAIKMPVFPFHTWQPDTYTDAPAQGTMLLSGIMLKMGIYGLIRWLIPLVPDGVKSYGHVAMTLAIIGVVYAGIIAIRQNDLKRLVAYSSISHVGLIAAGIFAMNPSGMQGGIIQMLNHGINAVGLFLVIDLIERMAGTRMLDSLGGMAKAAPRLAIVFMIIMLGATAVPLTNGFVGEFLLLKGIYEVSPWSAAIAGLTVIFCAVYMLRSYQFSMFGKPSIATASIADIKGSDFVYSVILCALVIGIGFYPQPLFDLVGPSVDQWINSWSTTVNP